MSFETVMFCFVLWIFIKHLKSMGDLKLLDRQSIMRIMLTDSIGYFFGALIPYAVAIYVWAKTPVSCLASSKRLV